MAKYAIQGKVAVVTGAASGIGLACAERLAAEGAKVVMADMRRDPGEAEAERVGAIFVPCDLSQASDCRALIEKAHDAHGRVDILVNNAGFQHIAAIEDFPEEQWNRMLAVMLTAPFLLTKHVWTGMKERRWGRIVNIGSIHSTVASPFKVGYVAAKHGLLGLTRAAALEGGEHGITVNAVCPAYVRTPLVENQIADQARTRGLPPERVVQEVMLGPAAVKRLIEPSEVAELAAYLCGDSAGVVTGAAWTMDLGWTAR